jgi:hypothetical protein
MARWLSSSGRGCSQPRGPAGPMGLEETQAKCARFLASFPVSSESGTYLLFLTSSHPPPSSGANTVWHKARLANGWLILSSRGWKEARRNQPGPLGAVEGGQEESALCQKLEELDCSCGERKAAHSPLSLSLTDLRLEACCTLG